MDAKLKKLWKDRKRIWKKYKTVICVELIFLCVILCCAGYLYRLERRNQTYAAQEVMKNIQSEVSKQAEKGSTADEIARAALELLVRAEDENGEKNFGLYLDLYNDMGRRIRKIHDSQVSCIWRAQTPEGLKSEWYFLNDYFSAEQVEEFFDYYHLPDGSTRSGCYIQQMTGYYKGVEKEFVPLEVVFGDENAPEETFTLQSRAKETIDSSRYVYRVGNIAADRLEYPEQTEAGYFSTCIYVDPNNLIEDDRYEYGDIEEGKELVNGESERHDTWEDGICFQHRVIGDGEVAGYRCEINADIKGLIRASGKLPRTILPVVFFFQALAAFLIIVTLYVQKKQEKLRMMRDTFLNAIAHEMKTPASVIKNSAECLTGGVCPEKQGHYIEMIGQESEHMNDLLNAMLTYSRVADTDCSLQKEECFLTRLAEEVCVHYADAMEKKQISLLWKKEIASLVHCDIKLVETVLDNFISNAVKFCRVGGVIRITMQERGICIYNEGSPISEDDIGHVWEPLYKGDDSRTYEKGSSGMGLAISAAILDLHGAEYGVKNVENGVEFFFSM